MKLADIAQNLELAKEALSGGIQADMIDITENEVTWQGYRSGIFKNTYYPLEYQWLIDNRQYSILLKDGSFLQFYYGFDEEGLRCAKTALYPRPISSKTSSADILYTAENYFQLEDNELGDHLLNVVEEIEKNQLIPANTSHVRFDYDREVKSHEVSQLQFGGANEVRIPANFFPTPFSFVQLVANAFEGFEISIPKNVIGHSSNKTLRKLKCTRLIHLGHLE